MKIDWFDSEKYFFHLWISEKASHRFNQWKFHWFRFREWKNYRGNWFYWFYWFRQLYRLIHGLNHSGLFMKEIWDLLFRNFYFENILFSQKSYINEWTIKHAAAFRMLCYRPESANTDFSDSYVDNLLDILRQSQNGAVLVTVWRFFNQEKEKEDRIRFFLLHHGKEKEIVSAFFIK